jgi:hypothetical protein
VSRRGQGRRARGRRADQDVELENTAWLEELEKAAAEHDDEEEEWASKLRRRRSRSPEPPPPAAPDPPGSSGGRPIGGSPWGPPDPPGPWGSSDPPGGSPEPPRPDPSGARAPELPRAPVAHDLSPYPPLGGEPAPPPPPSRPADGAGPTREPDYRLLGMEPDTGRPAGGWDAGWDGGNSHADAAADWTTRDRAPGAPSPAADPGTDWSAWSQPEGREGSGDPPGGFGEPQGPGGSGGPQGDPPMGRPPEDRAPGSGSPSWGAPVDRTQESGAQADWGYDLGEPDWRPVGPDATGVWSPAEPVGREPDYPALFGELNRRSAAQREALWDSSPPTAEPSDDLGSPEPPAPAWPFEEHTGTWEPSDRSFIWPAEELPAVSSEWEPAAPSWLDEPTAPPPSWSAAPAGTVPPGPAPAAPDGGAAPDDWAAGIYSGVPARGSGEREADAATRGWRPDEAVEAEPAVPLGADGMPPAPPPALPVADQLQMSEPADNWELYERPRSRWPKVVALVSWIVLLMVVCWFYVFPWLERVLPENF